MDSVIGYLSEDAVGRLRDLKAICDNDADLTASLLTQPRETLTAQDLDVLFGLSPSEQTMLSDVLESISVHQRADILRALLDFDACGTIRRANDTDTQAVIPVNVLLVVNAAVAVNVGGFVNVAMVTNAGTAVNAGVAVNAIEYTNVHTSVNGDQQQVSGTLSSEKIVITDEFVNSELNSRFVDLGLTKHRQIALFGSIIGDRKEDIARILDGEPIDYEFHYRNGHYRMTVSLGDDESILVTGGAVLN
ncbi:MAG: hypothetical protein ACI8U3_001260 [Brevundimonas sp.]|jgi:hypothetical protein|uniref:hypothetical protein n=1 Tax=Brevundimonas sp. TaxID=1871086 RepID=UPI0039E4F0DB